MTLHQSLQGDLGIDSLGRAELALEIKQKLGVELSDQVLFRARTPLDLLDALTEGEIHPSVIPFGVRTREVESSRILCPSHAQTWVEVLEWHASHHPNRACLDFIDSGQEVHGLTFGELFQHAGRFAAQLQDAGLKPREPVALMLPTGFDFLFSFFGAILAGGIPVPLYPPQRRGHIEDEIKRQVGILSNCESRFLITVPEGMKLSRILRFMLPRLKQVLSPQQLSSGRSSFRSGSIDSNSTAFLQYTSGSTGSPKGVALNHASILANIRAIGAAIRANSADVFVSWLPLYHDFGLIGACLGSLYYGAFLALTAPETFLGHPKQWLWMIHHYRGTLSGAPNFAYDFCSRRISDSELEHLDLSSWRVAINGAEPVSADTIQRFTQRFKNYGFRAEAMLPAYGLAESSVGLTLPPLERLPKVDRVDREVLTRINRAVPAFHGYDSPLDQLIVSCGMPLPGHRVRIVNEEDHVLPVRDVGLIQFQGPSSTQGYYRNLDANQSLFHSSSDPSYVGTWLDTGDLGYLAEGELYVTGRRKDVIIRGGQHFFPQDVEEKLASIPGILKGGVAVLGSLDPMTGTERIILVAETRVQDQNEKNGLCQRLRQMANELLGSPVDDVLLVPPLSIPKTPSGKLRRGACRELLEAHHLGRAQPHWMQWVNVFRGIFSFRLARMVQTLGNLIYGIYSCLWAILVGAVFFIGVVILPSFNARYRIARVCARILLFLVGIRLTVIGAESLPKRGDQAILVANHASYIDAMVLVASIPTSFHFIAKKEFLSYPVLGWIFSRLGCRFVERFDAWAAVQDTRKIADSILRDQILLFFPEGTFSAEVGLKPFRIGAFEIATQTQTKVIPLSIKGARQILNANTWIPKRGEVIVSVGPFIPPLEKSVENVLALKKIARQRILDGCGEPEIPD